ncbi:MAG: hypothetical protein P4L53_13815 [Candidatus Obscuribacterales bacterium]|nr:hypothetical protein [Candidatus Obscuribacterales bacterium]
MHTSAEAAPPANSAALKSKPTGLPSAKTEQGATDAEIKTVETMEQSAFGHSFPDDPIDKRLGRLELLTVRERQTGSVAERLAMLKTAIAQKHGPLNKSAASASKNASPTQVSAKLSRLEQNIMKKSYPQLAENARLSQLEKKVFGSEFPKLAAGERIERLQKTLGIGDGDVAMSQSSPGFSQFYNFSGSINGVPFSMHSGGNNAFSSNPAINRQLNDVFNQLNRQMQDMNGLNGMGPGSMMSPFDFGQGLLPGMIPNNMPRSFAIPKMSPELDGDVIPTPNHSPNHSNDRSNSQKRLGPRQFQQSPWQDGDDSEKNKLPPYLDPNSI